MDEFIKLFGPNLDYISHEMVDIGTHRLIDVLPSCEAGDVVEWLRTFPNLEVVSRDGLVTYVSAVSQADAGIIQVSDRKHSHTKGAKHNYVRNRRFYRPSAGSTNPAGGLIKIGIQRI